MSRGEPEQSGPKIYVNRVVNGSRKNRAQQSGAGNRRSRSEHGAVREDHRHGNAKWQNSPLRSAPLQCSAQE